MMRSLSISVVLVRTIYDSNIGSTSRAMSNMGANRLILIEPHCHITYAAQQAAASGQEALQSMKIYKDWASFYISEEDGIRIAFTARKGKGRKVSDFKETLEWLKKNETRLQKINSDRPLPMYLIFGPEDSGLYAKDLELVHHCCSIPTYGRNSSLNLSQATLLALFILGSNWTFEQKIFLAHEREEKNKVQLTGKIFPEKTLSLWLEEMGFDLLKRKINVFTVLKRMLLSNVPTQKELRILEIVIQQSLRKLKELNELKKELIRNK